MALMSVFNYSFAEYDTLIHFASIESGIIYSATIAIYLVSMSAPEATFFDGSIYLNRKLPQVGAFILRYCYGFAH
jgi:hypothetical protein